MKKRDSSVLRTSSLDDRLRDLEELADMHRHELEVQFDRIAQLQAEVDILRGGLVKSTLRAPSDDRAGIIEPFSDETARTDELDSGGIYIRSSSMSFRQLFRKPISWLIKS